jgi:hypothetical protein
MGVVVWQVLGRGEDGPEPRHHLFRNTIPHPPPLPSLQGFDRQHVSMCVCLCVTVLCHCLGLKLSANPPFLKGDAGDLMLNG